MKTKTIILVTFLFCITGYMLMAQPDTPDAPTPFGFVELLIGAGALFGGKKLYDSKKKKGK